MTVSKVSEQTGDIQTSAVVQLAVLLARHPQYESFIETQRLSNPPSLADFAEGLVKDLDIKSQGDLDVLPDFVELLMFVSSRRGYLDDNDQKRLLNTDIFKQNSLFRANPSNESRHS